VNVAEDFKYREWCLDFIKEQVGRDDPRPPARKMRWYFDLGYSPAEAVVQWADESTLLPWAKC
jgi:hypothetical protein